MSSEQASEAGRGRDVHGRRRRVRAVAIGAAVCAAVAMAGIGTANAATNGSWWGSSDRNGHHRRIPPRPGKPTTSPTARPTVSPTGPAGASPTGPSPSGTGGSATSPGGSGTQPAGGTWKLPPANGGIDYQIGGPYQPPSGVKVVVRDHAVAPAAGLYNSCYINAFQAQPDELNWWKQKHPDLLLQRNGKYVVDGDWNEVLLDVSTDAKRTALAAVEAAWIDECASRGYQAVEPDNLDSWSRSGGALTQDAAVAFAKKLVAYAHSKGLAIAQKNTVELSRTGKSGIGFDFAVAEECADYSECQGYVDAYGNQVYIIEYDNTHFQQACNQYGATLSVVRRDRDVTPSGSSGYVFQTC